MKIRSLCLRFCSNFPELFQHPVKGQSIIITTEDLSTTPFGLSGLPIQRAATSGQRATLSEQLNAVGSAFHPEVILAEECQKLIQTSVRAHFQSVRLHSESIQLPESNELVAENARAFKSSTAHGYAWHQLTLKWLKTPPARDSGEPASGDASPLSLEATLPRVLVIDQRKVEAMVAIRVVDLNKNQIIGKQFTVGTFSVRPIGSTNDFTWFVEDFRSGLNQTARKALKALKLL